MFKSTRCAWKGHIFVDSRSQPGMQVCIRCKHRQPFEGLLRRKHAERQPLPSDQNA